MLSFHFDREKTIQAAAYILSQRPERRMKYLLLLKLLYIADRESLSECLQPITGDAVYAMKHGPVLTRVKEMIDYPAEGWDDLIETVGYDAVLKKEPETSLLSDYEIDKLRDVTGRYRDEDRWNVVELTHDFPEWKNHYRDATSTHIPVEEIIRAVGREQDLEHIEEETETATLMSELFGD